MHNACNFMQHDLHQSERRNAILRILRGSAVRNQDELVGLLRREGHEVTQSSVSRDLRDLGVLKASGRYLPPLEDSSRTLDDFGALRQFVSSVLLTRRPATARISGWSGISSNSVASPPRQA